MWWIFLSIVFASDINVLVIDTGASSKNIKAQKYLMNYDESLTDHGPAIINTILADNGNWLCDNVKIDVCVYTQNRDLISYIECLEKAKEKSYDIINMSLTGQGQLKQEKQLLIDITKNSIVVVAAGNNGIQVNGNEKQYPAVYLYEGLINFYVVNNLPSTTSNFGDYTITMNGENILTKDKDNNNVYMSGTSFSAARYTHAILQAWCKEEYENNSFDNEFSTSRRNRSIPSRIYRQGGKQFKSNENWGIGRSGAFSNKTRVFKSRSKKYQIEYKGGNKNFKGGKRKM